MDNLRYENTRELENLARMSGSIVDMGNGYLARIEANLANDNQEYPNPFLFSLMLLGPMDNKLLWFENFTVDVPQSVFRGTRPVRCHIHGYNSTMRTCEDHWCVREFRTLGEMVGEFLEAATNTTLEDILCS